MSFLERNVRPQLVLYVQGFLLEVDAPAAFTQSENHFRPSIVFRATILVISSLDTNYDLMISY
jgi:hypothetical protein